MYICWPELYPQIIGTGEPPKIQILKLLNNANLIK